MKGEINGFYEGGSAQEDDGVTSRELLQQRSSSQQARLQLKTKCNKTEAELKEEAFKRVELSCQVTYNPHY